MQTSLERRVTALEQARPNDGDMVIIIRFEVPGDLGRELINLASDFKVKPLLHWTRRDGETAREFTDRASREVTYNPSGVALLMQVD